MGYCRRSSQRPFRIRNLQFISNLIKRNILAVGAWLNDGEATDPDDDRGNLCVFAFNGRDWYQLGNNIYGARSGDNLGRAVSMSTDGNIIATSIMHNGEDDSKSGSVHVYRFSEAMVDWTLLGSSVNSTDADDRKANSLACHLSELYLLLVRR